MVKIENPQFTDEYIESVLNKLPLWLQQWYQEQMTSHEPIKAIPEKGYEYRPNHSWLNPYVLWGPIERHQKYSTQAVWCYHYYSHPIYFAQLMNTHWNKYQLDKKRERMMKWLSMAQEDAEYTVIGDATIYINKDLWGRNRNSSTLLNNKMTEAFQQHLSQTFSQVKTNVIYGTGKDEVNVNFLGGCDDDWEDAEQIYYSAINNYPFEDVAKQLVEQLNNIFFYDIVKENADDPEESAYKVFGHFGEWVAEINGEVVASSLTDSFTNLWPDSFDGTEDEAIALDEKCKAITNGNGTQMNAYEISELMSNDTISFFVIFGYSTPLPEWIDR